MRMTHFVNNDLDRHIILGPFVPKKSYKFKNLAVTDNANNMAVLASLFVVVMLNNLIINFEIYLI